MNIPPLYKRLVTYNILFLAGALLLFIFVVRPKQKAVGKLEEVNNNKISGLRTQRYPRDPTQLLTMEKQLESRSKHTLRTLTAAFKRSREQFNGVFRAVGFGNVNDFREFVKLIRYQGYFDSVKSDLEKKQIFLDDEILGLTEHSSSPTRDNYQLVAHMSVVRDLALIADEHKLSVAEPHARAESRRRNPPARITAVLPITTYNTPVDPENAYLEEYAVRITVTGSISNFSNFLQALNVHNRFLPVRSVWIKKVGVRSQTQDLVEATVECGGFLVLLDTEQGIFAPESTESTKVWTRGA